MKYITYNNKLVEINHKLTLYDPFPPNGNEVIFYSKFDLVESSLYFKDLSSLQLDASALTTTTPYDSIALSTDIRLQNACSSAGCFSQFYNGTVPDASNNAKVVLLKDLSQLYFDNYIFSDVSNNVFLIYSAEQTNSNLDIILDKVEARIKKLKTWYSDPKNKSVYSHKVSDNIVIPSPNYYNKVIAYDISSNSIEEYATLSSGTSVGLSLFGTVLSNGQLVIFPYNGKYIIHIDPINKTANEYGDFSSFAAGRFMTSMNQSQILLTDGRVLGIPRTPTYFALYNPIDNSINTFGSLTNTAGSNKFMGACKINDNLYVVLPCDYNAILNIDPINKTVESYGSIGTIANKFKSYYKINDNLICCVPYSSPNVYNVDPINKTVESYGSLTGSNLYVNSLLLSSGKILAVPNNATNIILIDPINKTIDTFGNLGSTNFKYLANIIELNNGHVIAFPSMANYLIDIDPINKSIENIYDFGNSTYKFNDGVNTASTNNILTSISDNQIIGLPFNYPQVVDYNPINKKVFKIGYYSTISADSAKFTNRSPLIYYGDKKLIQINSSGSNYILDIELR